MAMDSPEDEWTLESHVDHVCSLAMGYGAGRDDMKRELIQAKENLRRAILKAREEAFEEAAKIADDAADYASKRSQDKDGAGSYVLRGSLSTATGIASAIRQHSQKGEK